ncbi:MAG: DinB family protein [Acidobacteriota bacterium]
MDTSFRRILWQQFGASIDMMENAVRACPETLWADRSRNPEFWYVVFHALFFLDYYLSESAEGFAPPPPFTLDELDPAGILPDRPYTKDELLEYLEHGRNKVRILLEAMTEEGAHAARKFGRVEGPLVESLLYNMRHVQHHAAQLNLLLRQEVADAPRWVSRARGPFAG